MSLWQNFHHRLQRLWSRWRLIGEMMKVSSKLRISIWELLSMMCHGDVDCLFENALLPSGWLALCILPFHGDALVRVLCDCGVLTARGAPSWPQIVLSLGPSRWHRCHPCPHQVAGLGSGAWSMAAGRMRTTHQQCWDTRGLWPWTEAANNGSALTGQGNYSSPRWHVLEWRCIDR